MRKTANYELNQWDTGDRILREEFNGDNARIDAALTGKCMDKLMDLTTTKDCSQVEVDLSSYDLAEYNRLIIRPALHLNDGRMCYLRLNGLAGTIYGKWNYLGGVGAMTSKGPGMGEFELILATPIIGRYLLSVQEINSTDQNVSEGIVAVAPSAVTPETLTRLTIFSDSGATISAGSRIYVLGVKA